MKTIIAKIALCPVRYLLHLLGWLFRLLPSETLTAFGAVLGRFASRFFPRELRISRHQLRFAFPNGDPRVDHGNTTDSETEKSFTVLTKDVFAHVGESIAELLIIDRLLELDKKQNSVAAPVTHKRSIPLRHFTASGEDVIDRIQNIGRGALTLSGHIGCIELLAGYYVRQGIPLTVAARLPNYPLLADYLEKLRRYYGVETVWREEPGSAKKLISAFRKGRFLAALIDQDTALESCYSPFFGLPAASPVALIRVAIQYNVPIMSSFIVRTARLKHHIETAEIEYNPKDPNSDRLIVESVNCRLERLICRYPEQWPWWHRRWRREPGIDYQKNRKLLRSTDDYLSWLSRQKSSSR